MTLQLIRTMTGVPSPSLWGTLSCDSQDRAGKYRKVETRNNLEVLGYNLFPWAPDGLGDSASSSLEFYLSLFLSYVKSPSVLSSRSLLVSLVFPKRTWVFHPAPEEAEFSSLEKSSLKGPARRAQDTSLLYLVSIRHSYDLCTDYFLNPSLKSALTQTYEFEHIPQPM